MTAQFATMRELLALEGQDPQLSPHELAAARDAAFRHGQIAGKIVQLDHAVPGDPAHTRAVPLVLIEIAGHPRLVRVALSEAEIRALVGFAAMANDTAEAADRLSRMETEHGWGLPPLLTRLIRILVDYREMSRAELTVALYGVDTPKGRWCIQSHVDRLRRRGFHIRCRRGGHYSLAEHDRDRLRGGGA